jgi:iron complex transport system substrate-binding protein
MKSLNLTHRKHLLISIILMLFFSFNAFAGPRIVSLAPNWTNIVAELGALNDLVGVTRYCIFPDTVPKMVKNGDLTVIGGFMDVNLQKVDSLKPDIVLTCAGLQKKYHEHFKDKNITIVHMDESSLEEVYSKIKELGQVIGVSNRADSLVSFIQTGLEQVKQKYANLPRVKVYYEINYFYKCVPGNDSYITELIKMVGGDPIFSKRPGIAPAVTWEEVVQANPDVIMLPLWDHAGGPYFEGPERGNGTTTPYEIASRPNADKVNAIKNGRVWYIDSAKTKQAGPKIPVAADLIGKTIHASGNKAFLKMKVVPEEMKDVFSSVIPWSIPYELCELTN